MLREMFKKTKYISLDEHIGEKDINRTQNINSKTNTMSSKEFSDSVNHHEIINDKSNNGIKRNKYKNNESKKRNDNYETVDRVAGSVEKEPCIPDGMWIKCSHCGHGIYSKDLSENYDCCPNCKGHLRMSASKRIDLLMDEGSFIEWDKNISTKNVLEFPKYMEKIQKLQVETGMVDAVITGEGTIEGMPCVISVMDSRFLMGSMGQVVGEKITRAVEKATKRNLPIIIFCASGGARMQEGVVSLMQMAKTSAAIKRHSDEGLLTITVLTDPTTGGVTASFAMLGDIILAEPGALIGFAGPRVIEQTIGQKLPDGFQRAEFLLEKGFVDRIVQRKDMKKELGSLLRMHQR